MIFASKIEMGKVKPTKRKSRKGKKKETAQVPIEKTEAKRLMLREIREEGYVILAFQPGLIRGAIVQITLQNQLARFLSFVLFLSVILNR